MSVSVHCSAETNTPDNILAGYMEDFKRDCEFYSADCSNFDHLLYIEWADELSSPQALATCTKSRLGGRWIRVKTGLDLSEIKLRTVMYHEFGHCILDRDHDMNVYTIMNAYLIDMQEQDWDRLVVDLFDDRDPIHVALRGFDTGLKID